MSQGLRGPETKKGQEPACSTSAVALPGCSRSSVSPAPSGSAASNGGDDRLAARLHFSVESCPRLLMAYSHGRNSGDGIGPCSKPLADSKACAIRMSCASLPCVPPNITATAATTGRGMITAQILASPGLVSRTPRRPPPCARRRPGSPGEPGLAGCSAMPRLSFISLLLQPSVDVVHGVDTAPRGVCNRPVTH